MSGTFISILNQGLEYLNQGLGYIVPAIVLLCLLIFIHELGHFLVARYYGVRVETFSLGFGPRIFAITHGETVYCVSAFPLGGYVKMYGDEPGRAIPPEEQKKSYLHKPVGQRIMIALAGPLMNLFFACFLFYFMAQWVGDRAHSPHVGEIQVQSMAYEKGFRPYDKIVSINGKPVKTWDQIKNKIENSTNQSLNFEIQRKNKKLRLSVIPKSSLNDNLFSTADRIGKIHGLHSHLHLPIVGVPPNSPLYKSGLRTGDRILEINGKPLTWFREIEPEILEGLFSDRGRRIKGPCIGYGVLKLSGPGPMHRPCFSRPGRVELKVRRFTDFRKRKNHRDIDIILSATDFKEKRPVLFIPETLIAEVQKDSPAGRAGLKKMDRISKINDQAIQSFDDIVKSVSSYKQGDPPLQIEVQRNESNLIFSIVPRISHLEGPYGETEKRFTIGIIPLLFEMPETFTWKSSDFTEALQRAFQQTWHWSRVTVLSLVRILQNRVSSKNISSFISIGQIAQQSWNLGLDAFLKIMAILSINLFIVNLLPIPILDGGQLLLFTLEAIRGAPLSLKKIEIAQQIGFLILLFLMVFALFNDFNRLFGS